MLPAMPSALVAVVRCEPAEARGRGRRAEDPADRRRVEAALVERAGRRHADARHDLVAGDHGGEQLATARAARLGDARAAAGTTTVDTCATESECVSSKSSPWQSIAFAKAAFGAGSAGRRARSPRPRARRPARPSSCGPPRRCRGRARRGRSRACRARAASPPRRPAAGPRRGRARAPTLRTARRAVIPSTPRSCPGSCAPPAAPSACRP